MSKCYFGHLTVGCWNIEGILENFNGAKISKLEDPQFQKILTKFDILCLQETHVSEDEDLQIPPGFQPIPHCRNISGNKRYFGGLLVLVRKTIYPGIKYGKFTDDDAFHLVLKHDFFGFDSDKNLIFTYASPATSSYTKSRSENIFDKIETKVDPKNLIIFGDLNGKTGKEDDFVRDNFDEHSPVADNPCYVSDIPCDRENLDTHSIDQQGKRILEICKNMSLRILNGRVTGDELGKFTRYPKHSRENPSTIDYALCSTDTLRDIIRFFILPFTGLSDHCCVQFNLRTNSRPSIQRTEISGGEKINPPIRRLKYDPEKKDEFKELLRANDNLRTLGVSLANNQIDQEGVDSCISTINEALTTSAKIVFHGGAADRQNPNKKKKKESKAWYTKECKSLRNVLRYRSKELSKDPFNRKKRDDFVKARTLYKKTCQKAGKTYRTLLTKQLFDIGMTNPKMFWNLIEKMNNWGKTKTDDTDGITPKRWVEHFSNLLNSPKNREPGLDPLALATFEPVLDYMINKDEMQEALEDLKKGKSPGFDQVLLEYLIDLFETHGKLLLKLMNRIFSEHIYPTSWTINFLKPIFKKGDKCDPDNYRGLAVGSAFAKLFSQILLRRLTAFVNEKGILSPNQGGFQKNMCTSDLIFLLQTIIEKFVKRANKKLYVAFIDFKKAYDTVDRDLLLKRLQALGINGLFLQNICAMYDSTKYAIKLSNGYLAPIDSNLGLKQGCPLSPMLFNLYIDDIKDIFDDQCHPVEIQETKISHFLYADDLVIISHTAEGLQTALNSLHVYSGRKCLAVSVKKSKTMIFNRSGKLIKKYFYLAGKPLEPVQSFCYLGFDVKASGTVKHAMNTLYEKANKAMRPLFQTIARFNLPVKTSLRIFHAYIEPIALYNAENWAAFTDKEIEKFSSDSLLQILSTGKADILHRKFLKYVLGTSSSCPNMAMYGDTNEQPLTMKAFRLMLNFWHRVTNLSSNTLVKKALLENINLRTNWIKTVEKLLGDLSLTDTIDETYKFKEKTRKAMEKRFSEYWNKVVHEDTARLLFYKSIKSEQGFEPYLDIPNFEDRKSIARLRCSNHSLHIEQGRHRHIPRENRLCRLCPSKKVETEEHFLTECTFFNRYRPNYDLKNQDDAKNMILNTDPIVLGKYLTEAFSERKKYREWFSLD